MGSKWKESKLALGLGLNKCLDVPKTLEDSSSSPSSSLPLVDGATGSAGRFSGARSPASSVSRLSKSSPKSPSKNSCAICLTEIKRGQGQAIFTAECSHSFHFQCITSNVKHGNQVCPICRSQWKEVPFGNPALPSNNLPNRPSRMSPMERPRDDSWTTIAARWVPQVSSHVHAPEPAVFDDDEALLSPQHNNVGEERLMISRGNEDDTLEIKTYPEVSAVAKAALCNDFAVLIHVKAPGASTWRTRAPVDLVTVVDISGSMVGTKLVLLKRAMGFVIQNLGPSDRLSVIVFSSTARRLFPLRLMSETGKQEALEAVNSLVANGGTNIAEGLRKGAKVIVERRWKNPVCSMTLLSDGQDTYTLTPGAAHSRTDYESLLPVQIQQNNSNMARSSSIPVHTFGFGLDHDAALMHSISEVSGGTFSFVEAENVIQDAFAQCIGGLLSVVVQELRLKIECVHPNLQIASIKAGSYHTSVASGGRIGLIGVGDLYAEEERDFLVILDIPADESEGQNEMSLLKVQCVYTDPMTKETVNLEEDSEVKIERPRVITWQPVESIEVDRQRNRFRAAEVMSEARALAERGDLNQAVSLLGTCQRELSETVSAQAGDRLCSALCAELLVMQERMANQRVYETTGRAYVLSSMSSHSWQRATARGDSMQRYSRIQAYQTSWMTEMVSRSQNQTPRRKLTQAFSFPARPHPR